MTEDARERATQNGPDILGQLTLEDTILWQGPALALAAQAFLLTIALGTDATRFERGLSAGLAFVSAAAAWHLIRRKESQVEKLEAQHGIKVSRQGLPPTTVWMLALVLFAFSDLFIIIVAVTDRPRGWLSEDHPTGEVTVFWIYFGFWLLAFVSCLGRTLWPAKREK